MVCQPVFINVFLSGKRGLFRNGSLDAETVCRRDRACICYCRVHDKREATPKVDKVDVVPQGWGNPVEVFEHALEHEKRVSRLIDELVQVASEEKDNATQDFLWQFVREQVEDEANVLNIVSHLRKAGDCAILFMDAKLGERES